MDERKNPNVRKVLNNTAFITLFLIPLTLIIFLFTAYFWSSSNRHLPNLQSSEKNTAVRGDIITADDYVIANSQKLYKVMIDKRSIDKNKIDLFIKLYCIYTNSDESKVRKTIQDGKNTIVLSYEISAKTAMHLKELSRKLNSKKVFISFKSSNGNMNPPIGMNVIESGERRDFLVKDSVTPVIGYTKKIEVNNITKIAGVKGIEKYYDYYLSPIKDEFIKGPRDIGNNIILEKSTQKAQRIDGYNVHLNIPLKVQKEIEVMLDKQREKYDAREIILGIINSKTGQVLVLASSSRYNPKKIFKKDYESLNSTATEYGYEAGSVLKPLIFSIIYDKGLVRLNEVVNTYNGRYKLGRRIIRDVHVAKSLTAEEVIFFSSNIGMIVLSSRLEPNDYYNGLLRFGLSQKTGIDLPYEQRGNIPSIKKLNSEVYKATTSYGYGLQVTFMQLLHAYSVFNNDGIATTPRIASYFEQNGKKYKINTPNPVHVMSKTSANIIKNILIKTVEEGTGKKAKIDGLIIGGKTGTARIAKLGGYSSLYNGSFLGFANDKNTSYTIGVLVREAKKGSYYAAQNALPTFKEAVKILIKEGYLKPSDDLIKKTKVNDKYKNINLEKIKD